ncbi:hypothetical protein DAPPUDRAFT_115039 [Daphnia pulex]|uniref:Uncharacterized protein n=1 Tax=Daphnia pulex TaxID=6669 RepID=E9HK05_DAPPU|nr:hypothetical protein DAPPUDRAFT_115039 [Daphnia pulex]|eukprot:EFX67932.1 hypothetical protein DAPPUDRAFT_115039 [Daphnia pulex]
MRIRTFLLGFEENSLKSCCFKSRSSCLGDWPDGTARNGVSAVARVSRLISPRGRRTSIKPFPTKTWTSMVYPWDVNFGIWYIPFYIQWMYGEYPNYLPLDVLWGISKMSYDITQQAAEKVFESLVENAVDKAMDRAVDFFQRTHLPTIINAQANSTTATSRSELDSPKHQPAHSISQTTSQHSHILLRSSSQLNRLRAFQLDVIQHLPSNCGEVACLLKFHLWTVLKAAMKKLGYPPKRESTQPFPPSKPYPKPSPSPKPSTSPKSEPSQPQPEPAQPQSEPAQPPTEVTVDICNHNHYCHFTK